MTEPLWSAEALAAATGAAPDRPLGRAVTGVSIDSRTLEPGDLFVAIRGDSQDGHVYVGKAFAGGASAAVVEAGFVAPEGCGPLLRVADPLAAMERLGRAARARSRARIVAVTGSVGKTGTKEALRRCLAASGPTHASEKSYNNHWGVPLTLARLPATATYGVLEIGMNHAGEIAPLTRMVRPHVAVVTTVGPVHIEFFPSEEAIADAKAEIFLGLEPGGAAVLNRDNRHFARLAAAAKAAGAGRIVSFGMSGQADARLLEHAGDDQGSQVRARIEGREIAYRIGAPGEHYVQNSLAVLAAASLLGADLERAARELAEVRAPVGRGERTVLQASGGRVLLIDESYNANPASVRAALDGLARTPRTEFPRRIAVLGDMRELGERSGELHRELAGPIQEAGIDRLLACGPYMAEAYTIVPPALRAGHAATSQELVPALLAEVRPGDAVMIKGSLGTRMAPLVEALRARFAAGNKAG